MAALLLALPLQLALPLVRGVTPAARAAGLLATAPSPPLAAFRLPSILASNMLLQRNQPAKVWGQVPTENLVFV